MHIYFVSASRIISLIIRRRFNVNTAIKFNINSINMFFENNKANLTFVI